MGALLESMAWGCCRGLVWLCAWLGAILLWAGDHPGMCWDISNWSISNESYKGASWWCSIMPGALGCLGFQGMVLFALPSPGCSWCLLPELWKEPGHWAG